MTTKVNQFEVEIALKKNVEFEGKTNWWRDVKLQIFSINRPWAALYNSGDSRHHPNDQNEWPINRLILKANVS